MSHGITKHDTHVGIEQSWHGLTTVLENITLENSGLNWEVTEHEVFDEDMKPITEWSIDKNNEIEEKPYKLIKAGNVPLAITRETYTTIQNKEIYDAFLPLVDEFGFRIVSAGSLLARKRVFFTLESDKSLFTVKEGDEHLHRLNVVSSHDGSLRTQFYNSNVRIVCANTLRFSQSDLRNMKADERNLFFDFAKHTKNAQAKLKDIQAGLMSFYAAQAILVEEYQKMDTVAINGSDAENIIAGFLFPATRSEKEGISTRMRNQIDRILSLFAEGKGNNGETLYDLFGGITEFFTHEASEDKDKLWYSSEFGTYADKKTEAFRLFQSQEDVERLAEKGKKLLALA